MLLAARRMKIPLILGSASDTGTNRGVEQYVRIVHELAAEHRLAPFKLAAIQSELAVPDLIVRLARGQVIKGLNGRADADIPLLRRTDKVVAVMEEREPTPAQSPVEVGIVVDVTCDDFERADTICHIAAKNLFYARLPNVRGTAGTAAILSDEVLRARPAYEWTLNHVIEGTDPREFFKTRFETAGAR
jgi:hypothetical protein